MKGRLQAVVLPTDQVEFAADLRRLFLELQGASSAGVLTGECAPPVDVYETDDTLEICMDVPGIEPQQVRIAAKGTALLIAGEKMPRRGRGDASYHLVERGYGRFGRAIRLDVPCDASLARATLQSGELRISVPKLTDRRQRTIPIAISSGSAAS